MSAQQKVKLDIFRHELVPKHSILVKDEVDELLRRYHIEKYQLPRIRVRDPAAVLIGAKPGDVIRIVRRSPTAGLSVYYRFVVGG
ncbi:MAG: DNA-directed RNA polymerase subunit H [Candidatus Bathyarchaeia archaeon]